MTQRREQRAKKRGQGAWSRE